MANPQPEKTKKSGINPFLRFTGIAFQMGVLIALGAWGGTELDVYAGNKNPVYTIILCLLAIGISLYIIIREAMKLGNEDK